MNNYLKKKISEDEAVGIIKKNPRAIFKLPKFWDNERVMIEVLLRHQSKEFTNLIPASLSNDTNFFINFLERKIKEDKYFCYKILNHAAPKVFADSNLLDYIFAKNKLNGFYQIFVSLFPDKFHTKENLIRVMGADDHWPNLSRHHFAYFKDNNIPLLKGIKSYLNKEFLYSKGINLKELKLICASKNYWYANRLVSKGFFKANSEEIKSLFKTQGSETIDIYDFYSNKLKLSLCNKEILLQHLRIYSHEIYEYDWQHPLPCSNIGSPRPALINSYKKKKKMSIHAKKWDSYACLQGFSNKNIDADIPTVDHVKKTLLSLKTKPRQKQINAFINIIGLHVRKLANFFDLNVNLSYAYRYGEKQTEHLFLNKDLEDISRLLKQNYKDLNLKKDLFKDKKTNYIFNNFIDFVVINSYKSKISQTLESSPYECMFTYVLIDTISKDYIQHIKKKNNIKSFIETYITYNSFNNTFMKERGKAVKSYLKKEDINKNYHYLYQNCREVFPWKHLPKPNNSIESISKILSAHRYHSIHWQKKLIAEKIKPSLFESKRVCYKLIQKSYKNLLFFGENQKKDREIISYACLISDNAFRWAHISLKKDIKFLKSIFKDPTTLFLNAHYTIRMRPEVFYPAYKKSPGIINNISWYSILHRMPINTLDRSNQLIIKKIFKKKIENLDVFKQAELIDAFKKKTLGPSLRGVN